MFRDDAVAARVRLLDPGDHDAGPGPVQRDGRRRSRPPTACGPTARVRRGAAAHRRQSNARSAAIETKLVQLRHETFATLEFPDAAGPAGEPDRRRATRDVARVARVARGRAHRVDAPRRAQPLRLRPRARADLQRPRRVPRDRYRQRARCLRRRGRRRTATRDVARGTSPSRPTAGEYRVGGRRSWVRASGGVWTADSPRMLFELIELIDETGVGAVVTEYLGERPALSANKCTLRRVPIDSNTDWHQDGAFLGARGAQPSTCGSSLSHCGVDAPGLDIVPRRLRRDRRRPAPRAPTSTGRSRPAVVDELAGTTRRSSGPSSARATRCCSTTCSCTAPPSPRG